MSKLWDADALPPKSGSFFSTVKGKGKSEAFSAVHASVLSWSPALLVDQLCLAVVPSDRREDPTSAWNHVSVVTLGALTFDQIDELLSPDAASSKGGETKNS